MLFSASPHPHPHFFPQAIQDLTLLPYPLKSQTTHPPLFFFPLPFSRPAKQQQPEKGKIEQSASLKHPESYAVGIGFMGGQLQCQADTIHSLASLMCHLILMSDRCLQHTAIALSSKSSCKRGSHLLSTTAILRIVPTKLYVLKAGWRLSQQPLQ